jgi:hypothetical protein
VVDRRLVERRADVLALPVGVVVLLVIPAPAGLAVVAAAVPAVAVPVVMVVGDRAAPGVSIGGGGG